MRRAGKNTKVFYDEAIRIIIENKEIIFKELENIRDKSVSNFFIWMFSGGSFGTKEMDKSFEYLSPKYPHVFEQMVSAYKIYLNKN